MHLKAKFQRFMNRRAGVCPLSCMLDFEFRRNDLTNGNSVDLGAAAPGLPMQLKGYGVDHLHVRDINRDKKVLKW